LKCYGFAGDVEYIVPIMLISIFEQLLLLCAVMCCWTIICRTTAAQIRFIASSRNYWHGDSGI